MFLIGCMLLDGFIGLVPSLGRLFCFPHCVLGKVTEENNTFSHVRAIGSTCSFIQRRAMHIEKTGAAVQREQSRVTKAVEMAETTGSGTISLWDPQLPVVSLARQIVPQLKVNFPPLPPFYLQRLRQILVSVSYVSAVVPRLLW